MKNNSEVWKGRGQLINQNISTDFQGSKSLMKHVTKQKALESNY